MHVQRLILLLHRRRCTRGKILCITAPCARLRKDTSRAALALTTTIFVQTLQARTSRTAFALKCRVRTSSQSSERPTLRATGGHTRASPVAHRLQIVREDLAGGA